MRVQLFSYISFVWWNTFHWPFFASEFSLSALCLFGTVCFCMIQNCFQKFHLPFKFLIIYINLMPNIKCKVYMLFPSVVRALNGFVIWCWVLNSVKPFFYGFCAFLLLLFLVLVLLQWSFLIWDRKVFL